VETKSIIVGIILVAVVAVMTGYVNSSHAQVITTPTTTYQPQVLLRYHGKFGRGPTLSAVEVSPEYNSTVLNILRSNSETSQLMNQGYSVIAIRPLIKAYVNANGDVSFKATQSIVVLSNSTAVYMYLVDISNNSVNLISYHSLIYRQECMCPCKTPR
jgi:hypothetical protein